jgi:flagellar biosynthesis protein FlhB
MSDGGEKTEQPTGRRMSQAISKGQFARTIEIQTVFVLTSGFLVIGMTGRHIIQVMTTAMVDTLGQLGKLTMSINSVQIYFSTFTHWLISCIWPITIAAMVAGILGSGLQSRFRLSTGRLEINWERLNPVTNAMQLFKPLPSLMRLVVGLLKLIVILGLTSVVIKRLIGHPIFYSATSFGEVMLFMVEAVNSITNRVLVGLALIAAADYGYQFWKNKQDLMMTKEEVKEETKNSEGNPQIKSELRKRRFAMLRQGLMNEIPKADVIVTNPTHLAIALRYDRKAMKAPKIVAKGARLNALRIREIAEQFQIPIVENKPVARFLFKHCKVGQEIPSQVYAAVAEILAYVYRVNRFRYHVEGQRIGS